MISYSQALRMLQAEADRHHARCEVIDIENAIGRYLAEDLVSSESVPAFDNSAMDGFSVNSRRANQAFAAGKAIRVLYCLAAGDLSPEHLDLDCAIEIMTGAAVPYSSYDGIVKIEDVEVIREEDGRAVAIKLKAPVVPGEYIRRAGEDFKMGQVVAEVGRHINENHILAFATLGISKVKVFVPPTVAIVSTGKELIPFEAKSVPPGRIRNSTGVYLSSYLRQRGISTISCGAIGDSAKEYISVMEDAFNRGAEVFVSTGAVSMGQFDFVKDALIELGAQIHFHKCAIRPGKPILFASLNYNGCKRYIFGVPGNPVSTAVGLRFFVMPFLGSTQRARHNQRRLGTLSADVSKPDGLRCFFKARSMFTSDGLKVKVLPGQASFMVSPLLESDVWVELAEEHGLARAEELVEVHEL